MDLATERQLLRQMLGHDHTSFRLVRAVSSINTGRAVWAKLPVVKPYPANIEMGKIAKGIWFVCSKTVSRRRRFPQPVLHRWRFLITGPWDSPHNRLHRKRVFKSRPLGHLLGCRPAASTPP
jgi:hypothetical protein